ncbi:MAG: alanine racemase, partial [Lentimicrobiaceae bacterium]|nr:alanine racemase [Lentimicrobiaceae bacterium]
YVDEAISLRNKNITMPIMVMNPDELGMVSILKYDLQPEIYSFRVLNLLLQALEQNTQVKQVSIHLKIDTGMHRLGFEKKDLPDLAKMLKNNHRIKVESIFTHFAAADDPNEDDFTHCQAVAFSECYDFISAELGYQPIKHLANSAALSRFPEYHYDMVRLGIGLYGVNPFLKSNKIARVVTLKTIVSQIKHIEPNDTVGYNRKWKARKKTVVATIPIGYADGFPRAAGNGKVKVLINGKLAPIIGNVCMDMCMADVTNINVKEGDTVIVIGKDLPLTLFAQSVEMIEYEILTGISQRVKRVFVSE